MQNTTQPIDRASLLIEANKLIRDHEDTLAGIEATGVEQRNGVLVFSGEYFLDEQGLPTPKSTAVFNMFKYLAHTLSESVPPGRLKRKTRGICLAFFSLQQRLFGRAATSKQQAIQRFLPRYW